MNANLNFLKQLGMNEKEAKVYLVALEFGPISLIKLAQKSGIKRTTIYEFADDMVSRGILNITVSGKRKLYHGAHPDELGKLIEKQKEALDNMMPELLLLAEKNPKKPKIRFYEGVEGVKTVYNDIVKKSGGSMVYVSSFEDMAETLPASFLESFFKRKVKNRVWARGIMPSGKQAAERSKNNKKELRESIIVPFEEFPIRGEVIVYEDKVAITSLTDEKISIIIESQQNAENQRAIINLLWKCLKLLEKHKIKLN